LRYALKNLVLSIWEGMDRDNDEKGMGRALLKTAAF